MRPSELWVDAVRTRRQLRYVPKRNGAYDDGRTVFFIAVDAFPAMRCRTLTWRAYNGLERSCEGVELMWWEYRGWSCGLWNQAATALASG